ncbi:DUF1947 domain-containing protein [Candidatus Woesearchaeota archaeon]|nr:DUF1947 domain-containing protein [Candidatus Woesearchaeota archaeon]
MFLRKDEIKQLNKTLEESYNLPSFFSKKDAIEKKNNIIYKNREPLFFEYEGRIVPTLKFILKLQGENKNFLKKIVVDMPAVPFMAKGADVMRPGIVEFDDNIKENEIIVIVDQNNKKALAIGISTLSSEGLKETDKGKVIKNIHYVGDEIWKAQF